MTTGLLKSLRSLFGIGTCRAGDSALDALVIGLTHPSADGGYWVLSRRLLDVRAGLSSHDEAVAAVLAGDEHLCAGWLGILAARCREAGQLTDAGVLVQLVSQLGAAAPAVEAALDGARLAATDSTDLERELFGASAEQARSTPALARVLAAHARLSRWRTDPLPALMPVDPTGAAVDANWCPGRLLALPGVAGSALPARADWLLPGAWRRAGTTASEAGSGSGSGSEYDSDTVSDPGSDAVALLQDWVLPNPWPLLLAVIGLVQDAWAAEGRGGLLLELPRGQHPLQTTEIQVLVALEEGHERLCGTLGGLVLALLARLGMALFPQQPSEAELNRRLAALVGELLRHRVWSFDEGLADQPGQYRLSDEFSDACYRRVGVQALGRNGRQLRGAVRAQAQQWRRDGAAASPAVPTKGQYDLAALA